jgi:DNA-binding NarL/FixJ family response regulator
MMLSSARDICVVGEAATGEEAVALAGRCAPSVVLMDVDMPGSGGIEATRVLTSQDPHPMVLMLTMHPECDHLIAALRAGASGYLTKDVTREELLTAVRQVAVGEIHVRPESRYLLAEALRRPSHPAAQEVQRARFETLSRRQQKVLLMVAQGHTGPEIGGALGLSVKTVDTHRHRIRDKLGLTSRAAYVKFALAAGLMRENGGSDAAQ